VRGAAGTSGLSQHPPGWGVGPLLCPLDGRACCKVPATALLAAGQRPRQMHGGMVPARCPHAPAPGCPTFPHLCHAPWLNCPPHSLHPPLPPAEGARLHLHQDQEARHLPPGLQGGGREWPPPAHHQAPAPAATPSPPPPPPPKASPLASRSHVPAPASPRPAPQLKDPISDVKYDDAMCLNGEKAFLGEPRPCWPAFQTGQAPSRPSLLPPCLPRPRHLLTLPLTPLLPCQASCARACAPWPGPTCPSTSAPSPAPPGSSSARAPWATCSAPPPPPCSAATPATSW